MAFFETTAVRENLTGSTSNSSYDFHISRKGPEADDRIADMIFRTCKDNSRVLSLPAIDVARGTVNGVAASQNLKSAASNMATALVLYAVGHHERGKTYERLAKEAVESYIKRLEADGGQAPVTIL